METRGLGLAATLVAGVAHFGFDAFDPLFDAMGWTDPVPPPPLPPSLVEAIQGIEAEKSVINYTALAEYDAQEAISYLQSLDADAARMIEKIDVLVKELDAITPINEAEAAKIADLKARLLEFKAGNISAREQIATFLERGIDPENRPKVVKAMHDLLLENQDGYYEYMRRGFPQPIGVTGDYGVDETARAIQDLRK